VRDYQHRPIGVVEDVVGDAAEEGGDAGQSSGSHDDEVDVEFVGAFRDCFSDVLVLRGPEGVGFEAGFAC
jgi:hypothetical protein